MRKFLLSFSLFLSTAFLTNFLWESLHAIFLYSKISLLSIEQYIQLMLEVSLKDMFWLGAVFVGLGIYYRNPFWFERFTHGKLQAVLAVPLVIALLIEMQGVFVFQKWTYTSLMPTILGLGVSPLLQLPLTMLFAVLVVHRLRSAPHKF